MSGLVLVRRHVRRRVPRRHAPAAVALALVLSAGCTEEFAPASLVQDARLIAVVADPPEAVPGAQVALTPIVASPTGSLVAGTGFSSSWWRCPDGDSDPLGDFSQCTTAGDRVELGGDVPYADTVPADLFGATSSTGGDAPEASFAGEHLLGAVLGYWRVVGVDVHAGDRVVAGFKRIPVYPPVSLGAIDARLTPIETRLNADGELVHNDNPLLQAVIVHEGSVDGPAVTSVKKGGTYFFVPVYDERAMQDYTSLKVDLAGLPLDDAAALQQLRIDDLLPRFERVQRCEVPVFSWFVTAGRVRRETTLDEGIISRVFDARGIDCPAIEGDVRTADTEFTAPSGSDDDGVHGVLPSDGVVHGWVVLRDGRGGADVLSFDLPLAP